jgi:hypothetical protein
MIMATKLEVLEMIITDMEEDVKKFDGAPLTGKTVAEIHANLAAAIQALAKVVKAELEATH